MSVDDAILMLTKKEKKILEKVAEGLTTKQIADVMHLSESTIKNHRHNICRKLELPPNTSSLLNWVLRNNAKLNFDN